MKKREEKTDPPVEPIEARPAKKVEPAAPPDAAPQSNRSAEAEASRSEDSARRFRHGLAVAAYSLLILVIVYGMFSVLSAILQPLFIAAFLCYLIVPAHRWLAAHRIPSLLSYLCIVLGFIFVMVWLAALVTGSVQSLTDEKWPDVYRPQFEARLLKWGLIDPDGESPELAGAVPAGTVAAAPEPSGVRRLVAWVRSIMEAGGEESNLLNRVRESINIPSILGKGLDIVQTTLGTFIDFITVLLVVLFYLVFLLAEIASFQRRMIRAFGKDRATRIAGVIASINGAISQYLVVKTAISLIVATVTTVILLIFGVDFALMWGVLTFFANFVPYVGSAIAMLLPIGLAFIQFENPWIGLSVGALLLGAQQATGNLLEPRLMGKSLGLSPLMILLSLAFWGSLWGIVGMVLSIPLLVCVRIVLENIEQTRPVAKLISNI